jgi:DNA-binding NarL/FixJ family response regulator
MERIRVLLVDDHRPFLVAAGHLLSDDPMLDVVGMMVSPRDALRHMAALRPHVVLLQLEMTEMSGLVATLHIKTLPHGPKVIIVTDHDEPIYQELARAVHVDALLSKPKFDTMALPTIKYVFSGRSPFSSDRSLGEVGPAVI